MGAYGQKGIRPAASLDAPRCSRDGVESGCVVRGVSCAVLCRRWRRSSDTLAQGRRALRVQCEDLRFDVLYRREARVTWLCPLLFTGSEGLNPWANPDPQRVATLAGLLHSSHADSHAPSTSSCVQPPVQRSDWLLANVVQLFLSHGSTTQTESWIRPE